MKDHSQSHHFMDYYFRIGAGGERERDLLEFIFTLDLKKEKKENLLY